MDNLIYRVQDIRGYGPFQPGLSGWWSDGHEEKRPAPLWSSMPHREFNRLFEPYGPQFMFGHAFRRVEQVDLWFSRAEQRNLYGMGFRLVSMRYDHLLHETPEQVLFARLRPFTQYDQLHPFPQGIAA